ncbi:guanylate kinase [Tessaracoccus defluvii]|uniref:Guanylate kinase n=1 Tax=Tessaracoccus defluvii TaxID=1285901 RepID=A0A7H0H8B0_9ACTN|nr:guanylate kinase [Tessaracoccus defluvii]QNP56776.1 guanylate kinase [Tessaracoccus defluvii]
MSASHVWVISGPSAVGKGTVCARLQELHPEPYYSISMTTRPPRTGEVDGESYHFVDVERFRALIEAGDLLEWAVVHGTNYYGTPRRPVEEALASGRQVVLEIDLQGARQVKSNLPEARLVFLTPPSWDELVTRLKGRGTEDTAAQERRLETAKLELAAIAEADHVIENAVVDATVAELARLLDL